jgi:hypothetical protein
MTYPSETVTAKQYSTAVAVRGALLISIVSVVQFEGADGALYEVRLLAVEGFDTATFLVTRIK